MTIVLTGVSRGLGYHLLTLLKDKYNIICIGRSFPYFQQNIINIIHDLKNVFNKDLKFLDTNVLFINNAATIDPIAVINDLDNNKIIESCMINYITPITIIKQLISKSNKLQIINISTNENDRSINNLPIYLSSKRAMRTFLDCIVNDNISVKHVYPPLLDTDMQHKVCLGSKNDYILPSTYAYTLLKSFNLV